MQYALFFLWGYWMHLEWDDFQRIAMYVRDIKNKSDGCNFVHIKTCEYKALVVSHPFHFAFQCSSF